MLSKLTQSVLVVTIVAVGSVSHHDVQAHGDGASWEVPTGEYVADVGYEPGEFVAGEYTLFAFDLKNTDGTSAAFAEAWVRIKSPDNTYLATGVRKQPTGPTTLVYTFANPGAYSLEVSYRDASSNELATASFSISVAGGESAASYPWSIYLGAGAILGVVLASLFSTATKLRKS